MTLCGTCTTRPCVCPMTCDHNFKGMSGALCPLCPTDVPVEPLTDAAIEAAVERGRQDVLGERVPLTLSDGDKIHMTVREILAQRERLDHE